MPAQRCSPLGGEVRVTERHERGLTTSMTVDPDEAIFAGHYPGFPIFPGVCLVECAIQSVLAAAGAEVAVEAIESTRFLAPVYPGDTVVTRVEGGEELWRCALGTERGRVAEVRLRVRRGGGSPPPALAGHLHPVLPPTGSGIAEIKQVLPHRYPMLLVDRVVEVEGRERLTAIKAVSGNEPWYRALGDARTDAAHAYPQALLIESWGQAAGVLAAWDQRNPDVLAGQVMLFGSMTGVRFHDMALPGDVLQHRVRAVRYLSDAAIFEGETLVDGSPVLEVERVVMAMRPADVLRPALAPQPA